MQVFTGWIGWPFSFLLVFYFIYRWVPVTELEVDIIDGGTSCKTLSKENTQCNENCIEDLQGESGVTWSAMLESIFRLRPVAVLTENVRSMFFGKDSSPALLMQKQFAEMQYVSAPNQVDSRAALNS